MKAQDALRKSEDTTLVGEHATQLRGARCSYYQRPRSTWAPQVSGTVHEVGLFSLMVHPELYYSLWAM